MAVNNAYVNDAKDVLWQDEQVMQTARQRKLLPAGGAIINPTTVLATTKRVIIVNRSSLGLRKDFESIPYKMITSVRLERGFVSSSIFLRVSGYTSPGEQGFLKRGNQEGEISGLTHADAKAVSDFISKEISGAVDSGAGKAPAPGAAVIFCIKCGARNSPSAKFCSSCGAKLA